MSTTASLLRRHHDSTAITTNRSTLSTDPPKLSRRRSWVRQRYSTTSQQQQQQAQAQQQAEQSQQAQQKIQQQQQQQRAPSKLSLSSNKATTTTTMFQQEPSPSPIRHKTGRRKLLRQPQSGQQRLLSRHKHHRPWRQDLLSQSSTSSHMARRTRQQRLQWQHQQELLRSIQEEEDDEHDHDHNHEHDDDLQSLGEFAFPSLGSLELKRSMEEEENHNNREEKKVDETTTTTNVNASTFSLKEEEEEDENEANPKISSKLNQQQQQLPPSNHNQKDLLDQKNPTTNSSSQPQLDQLHEQLQRKLATVYQGHHVVVEAQGLGGRLPPAMVRAKQQRALEHEARQSLRQQLTRVLQERFGGGVGAVGVLQQPQSSKREQEDSDDEEHGEDMEDDDDEDWDDSTIASRASHFLLHNHHHHNVIAAEASASALLEEAQSNEWEEFTVHDDNNDNVGAEFKVVPEPVAAKEGWVEEPQPAEDDDDVQSEYTYETIYTRQTLQQQQQQQKMAQHALRLLGLPDPGVMQQQTHQQQPLSPPRQTKGALRDYLNSSQPQHESPNNNNNQHEENHQVVEGDDASFFYDEITYQESLAPPQPAAYNDNGEEREKSETHDVDDDEEEYEEETYFSGEEEEYEEETYMDDCYEPDDYYWDDQTIQTVADAFVSLPRAVQLEFLLNGNNNNSSGASVVAPQSPPVTQQHCSEQVRPPPVPPTRSPTSVLHHDDPVKTTSACSPNAKLSQRTTSPKKKSLLPRLDSSSSSASATVSESESYSGELDASGRTSLGSASRSLDDWLPADLAHSDPDQVTLALSELYSHIMEADSSSNKIKLDDNGEESNKHNSVAQEMYRQVRMGPHHHSNDTPSCAGGLILAVVRAMERNLPEKEIQVQACRVLRQLCEYGYKAEICHVGGVDAVLGALSNHFSASSSASVSSSTSSTGKGQLTEDETIAAQVACQCLLELVTPAATTTMSLTVAEQQGQELSSSVHSSSSSVEVTAVHVVVSCMKHHPKNTVLQEACFQIVAHLCLDDPQKLEALSQCGGLITLSQSLTAHWHHKSVQQQAIATMAKLYAKLGELSESGQL